MNNESSKLIVKLQEENTALKIKVTDLGKKVFELEAQVPKWINVSKGLPDYGDPVLLKINGVIQHVTYMRDGSDDPKDWFEPLFCNDYENAFFIDFESDVKWMPLPPEEQDDE